MSPAPPGEHTLPLLETEERASEITQCRENEGERDRAESERWWGRGGVLWGDKGGGRKSEQERGRKIKKQKKVREWGKSRVTEGQ